MSNQLQTRALSNFTLFSAIGLMCAAVIPHFAHVETFILVFFISIALLRIALLKQSYFKLRKWLVLPLLAIGIANVYWLYGIPIGTQPGVAFLITLLGLKMLEISTRRDIYILVFLAWFTIATQFLFENDLLFTLYLLGILVLLVWLLMTLNRDHPTTKLSITIKDVSKIILPAIPVTLVLFYLFPRLASPLWEITSHEHRGVTGLSDSISLGSISQLSQSHATAFRVTFDETLPEQKNLYWRGPVLWDTDGVQWNTGELLLSRPQQYELLSGQVSYEVIMEANNQPWLFALDLPATIPANSRLTRDFRLIAEKPVTDTLRYSITSRTNFTNHVLASDEKLRALHIPDAITDRVRQFAQSRKQQSTDQADYINTILRHFNQQPYIYTLRPPLLGDNPIDEFLFETRRGFCEHYASSFVMLMRAAGIPSRIVTGYQGGEFNPVGGYLRVRQSDAHAWSEVWLDQTGWIRIDPTAAVAPERVERPIDLADSNADGQLLFRFDDKGLLSRMGLQAHWLIDSIQLNWKRWIVNFDQKRQRDFLSRLGLDGLSDSLLASIAILIATLLISLFAIIIMRLNRTHTAPVVKLYQKFSMKLKHAGLERHANEGPLDYLHRIRQHRPDLDDTSSKIIQRYIAIRYNDQKSNLLLKEFSRMIQQFRVKKTT